MAGVCCRELRLLRILISQFFIPQFLLPLCELLGGVLGEAFLEIIVAALEVVELGFGAQLVLGAGLGGFCKLGHFSG